MKEVEVDLLNYDYKERNDRVNVCWLGIWSGWPNSIKKKEERNLVG